MVYLDVLISSANATLNCPSNWVTFSCSGTYNPKDIAYRKVDLAQMAKATGRPVTVLIDDTKKHNGFCYAWRLDIN